MAKAYKCDICGKYTDEELPFTIYHPKEWIASTHRGQTACCSATCAKTVTEVFVVAEERSRLWAEEAERRSAAFAAFEAATKAAEIGQ